MNIYSLRILLAYIMCVHPCIPVSYREVLIWSEYDPYIVPQIPPSTHTAFQGNVLTVPTFFVKFVKLSDS